MRPKSELLLRDEYCQRFVVFKMTEMLQADSLGVAGPMELRVEYGERGWDDLLELYADEHGRVFEHRWQVKRQSTPLAKAEFEKLIRSLAAPGSDFLAFLGLQDLVEIKRVGELRILRDLCQRVRGDAVHAQDIDLEELARNLSTPENGWVAAILQALAHHPSGITDQLSALILLRRLHIKILNDLDELKERALNNLRYLFADPNAAWQGLHTYASANPCGHIRITARALREGPLRDQPSRPFGISRHGRSTIESYLASLRASTIAPEHRVETGLRSAAQPLSLDSLCEQLAAGTAAVITGPSGCGKTHLLRTLCGMLAQRGVIPVRAEAKYFEGYLEPWLDETIAPLKRGAFRELVAAAHAAGHPLVLLVDAIEETQDHEQTLLRSLYSAAERQEFTLLLAARKLPDVRASRLDIEVALPDLEAKRLLFSMHAPERVKENGHIEVLLDGLTTPLEVQLAAHASDELPPHPTLYQLFATYVRRRVGEDARGACTTFLSDIAAQMGERFTTTITSTSLRRLASRKYAQSSIDPVSIALQAGLLVEHMGRVGFRHELFRLFFEAEALLLKHNDDVEDLAIQIERPRYRELDELVAGALDGMQAEVFVCRCSDIGLLFKAIAGRLGLDVQRATQNAADALLSTACNECEALTQSPPVIAPAPALNAVRNWSKHERALMQAIGWWVARGLFWHPLVTMIRIIDHWWIGLHCNDRAALSKFRHHMVQNLYLDGGQDSLAISTIFASARHSRMWRPDSETQASLEEAAIAILKAPDQWTPGVLFLLGELKVWNTPVLRSYLPAWFDACWQSRLYNIRLAATESITYAAAELEDAIKHALLPRLQDIWNHRSGMLFGPIEYVMQALISFSALAPVTDQYLPIAEEEVRAALTPEETEDACKAAWRVYNNRAEEHIGDAYCIATEDLSSDQRRLLLIRAAKGARMNEFPNFGMQWILQELLAFADPLPEDVFSYCAVLPFPKEMFDGEGPAAFIYANAGLGRQGQMEHAFGSVPEGSEYRIWHAIGLLIRHLHREPLDIEGADMLAPWSTLQKEPPWLVLDALRRVHDACMSSYSQSMSLVRDPLRHFPVRLRDLALRALSSGLPVDVSTHCIGPTLEPVSYAIRILEMHGDTSCVPVLEQFVEHRYWGHAVIVALRAIRQRTAT